MSTVDLSDVRWRKSTFSSGSGDTNCVEVALTGDVTALRDSKNAAGPALALPADGWQALLAATR